MANHPNRSTNLRTVAFKIQEGGGLAAVHSYGRRDAQTSRHIAAQMEQRRALDYHGTV